MGGVTLLSHGAPGALIDIDGEVAAAVSLTVENGRITRIYAILNPHKLARLDAEAALAGRRACRARHFGGGCYRQSQKPSPS